MDDIKSRIIEEESGNVSVVVQKRFEDTNEALNKAFDRIQVLELEQDQQLAEKQRLVKEMAELKSKL